MEQIELQVTKSIIAKTLIDRLLQKIFGKSNIFHSINTSIRDSIPCLLADHGFQFLKQGECLRPAYLTFMLGLTVVAKEIGK